MASAKGLFLDRHCGFQVPLQSCGLAVCCSTGVHTFGFESKMTQGSRMGMLAGGGWNLPQQTSCAISVPSCPESLFAAG